MNDLLKFFFLSKYYNMIKIGKYGKTLCKDLHRNLYIRYLYIYKYMYVYLVISFSDKIYHYFNLIYFIPPFHNAYFKKVLFT